jgi:hypothetical protein
MPPPVDRELVASTANNVARYLVVAMLIPGH